MVKDFLPILRNKNFVYIWSSQVLSQLSINIINFLLLIRLFEKTGSSIATSLLWISYALPAILIGPFAAASCDMVDKRKLLIWTNLLQSLTIFIYALIHETSVFLLYGVAFAYSLLNQFYVPAEASSLPQVVKGNDLPKANGLFFFTQQGALIVGFGLAGPTSLVFGFQTILIFCSLLLLTATVSVYFLPIMRPQESFPKKLEKLIIEFFERIYNGYILIRSDKNVLTPFLLLLGIQVALTVIIVNTPVIAIELFKIPVNFAGSALVVPAGFGAAAGAIIIPRFLNKGARKIKIIENSLILLVLSFFAIFFIISEFSLIYRLILGFLAIAALGASFVGILIPSQTFLQEKTPSNYRGRVFGNYWFLVTIATVFPVIFSGTLTELFGIRLLLFLLGGAFLVALVFLRSRKQQNELL